ncbi:MAG TPA: type II toxin-antitoxin system prevent-host-death family antitoxin [Polyangia bacterium]|jgi:tRNA(fMet)-specific endonuclease VapC|nr:type II toxin-antitoxin system prevent-host-death family antitoxin [Polyangia bacterium]
MSKSYSVADARANLPDILDDVEAGREVQLTRRGQPVAVVISPSRYEALRSQHANFGDAYRAFVGRFRPEDIGLEPDFFDSIRDQTPGTSGPSLTLKFPLDTTIVAAPVKKLEQQSPHCAIAAPVWHELVYGCSRLPVGKRRTALEAYLHAVVRRSFPVLPYDDAAAEWHGRERARLQEAGRPAPFVDGQIAAIAHTQGLTLVTAEGKDFEPFADLATADWTR